MHPITGPLEKTVNNSSPTPGAVYYQRTWYRQEKPYNLPLYFKSYGFKTISGKALEGWYSSPGWSYNPQYMYAGFNGGSDWWFERPVETVASQCREQFNSKLRSVAEIGAALGEAKQSISMVSNRAVQLYRFAKKLKRLDFLGAGRELNVAVYGKGGGYFCSTRRGPKRLNLREESHAFSANLLEFSFGWAPLVSDIEQAISIFGNPYIGNVNVKAHSAMTDSYFNRFNAWYPWAPIWNSATHDYKVVVKCQANVRVVNPNANLAAQLGLVNPVAVAWELTPFSFVVDYFVNIQSFLESFTSQHGLELSSTSSTTFVKDNCYATQVWYDGTLTNDCSSVYWYTERNGSLPEVTLRIKELTLPIGRALTSIALLISLGIEK